MDKAERIERNNRLSASARALLSDIQESSPVKLSTGGAFDLATERVRQLVQGEIQDIAEVAHSFEDVFVFDEEFERKANSKTNPVRMFIKPETDEAVKEFARKYKSLHSVNVTWPWVASKILEADYVLRNSGDKAWYGIACSHAKYLVDQSESSFKSGESEIAISQLEEAITAMENMKRDITKNLKRNKVKK